jgi:chemotaxis protein MotB
MSVGNDQKRPIIVKRIIAHDEGHGGQWKVAYADFVTAMMAFFLIMWLLSATTSNDRQVIAKYFTSTSIFDLPAGNGLLNGGRSVMEGADPKPLRGAPAVKDAKPDQRKDGQSGEASAPPRDRTERQRFEALKANLEQIMKSGELKSEAANMDVAMTSDGVRIQIFDRDGEPMFSPGGSEPLPRLKAILDVVAQVLGTVQNSIILAGHTDGHALQRGTYSNWELSADRANAVRRTLESIGLAPGRIVQVEGRAATDPLLPLTPLDPRNRRIAITILRGDVDPQARLPIDRNVPPPTSN